jgi:hypothetical protein
MPVDPAADGGPAGMRTSGDDSTTDSRPLGDEDGGGTASSSGTESGPFDSESDDFGSEIETEPVGAETSGGFDAGGDTGALDEAIADLSDEEADEMVLDVFEGVYGDEAEGILQDLQENLGLDSHAILEILLGEPGGGGAYGDGQTVDSSTDSETAAQSGPEGLDDTEDSGDAFGMTSIGDTVSDPLADDHAGDELADGDFAAAELMSTDDDVADEPEPADDPVDLP